MNQKFKKNDFISDFDEKIKISVREEKNIYIY